MNEYFGDRGASANDLATNHSPDLARITHETPTATADMAVLPGVLRPRILRRTIQVRLGCESLRLPGGKSIFTVSRYRFMSNAG